MSRKMKNKKNKPRQELADNVTEIKGLSAREVKIRAWVEDNFILVDEICNSGEYYIGGWRAANYYHLTDQIPFWTDVFTLNRRGKKIILNNKLIFHELKNIDKSKYIIKKIKGHQFKILTKKESKKWLKLREYML